VAPVAFHRLVFRQGLKDELVMLTNTMALAGTAFLMLAVLSGVLLILDYVVGRAEYASNARGAIIGDRTGFLKLLFRRSDMRLLGVHVLGEHATELVHVGMLTLLLEGGAADLQRACFNVPTLSNLYKDAAYRAQIARDLPLAGSRTGRRRAAARGGRGRSR